MNLGKSIRIYLKEGTVTGIKLAEVVNLTIQAFSCPRNKLLDLNKYFSNESNRPGIYFLIGIDDKSNNDKVYIGEAENVWERLKTHDIKKDFWNEVILFTSKDENLTKSHVKYLESRLISISNNSKRYQLENSNSPSLTSLPLPDKDAMEDFILNIKLLTGTLGHKFLEAPLLTSDLDFNSNFVTPKADENFHIETKENMLFELNVKGVKAKAIQTDEGVVVLEHSEISETASRNYGYKTLREKLIEENIIENNKFTKNYLFQSPSAAAAVIVGYSINGRNTWKNNNGKSLKEIEENEIKNSK